MYSNFDENKEASAEENAVREKTEEPEYAKQPVTRENGAEEHPAAEPDGEQKPQTETAPPSADTEQPAQDSGIPSSENIPQDKQDKQDTQNTQPAQNAQVYQYQYAQNVRNGYYTGYNGNPAYGGTYTPPPSFRQCGYAPQIPQPEQKKRRFSDVPFRITVFLITAAFIAIIVMCALISAKGKPNENGSGPVISGPNGEYTLNGSDTERPVIIFRTAERPVLEDEMYADKETGLLTTVGVAKVILPSQVQIKKFEDVPYVPTGWASGVILTEDGYILTNAHVVNEAKRVSVRFYDDTEAEAYIVGIDTRSDLAVIKVDKTGLTPAQLGTSANLCIGEEVALAGAGGGLYNTVNYGHITGLEREMSTDISGGGGTMFCIQSDAALNFGNSGGALVNMYGQVIGIPTLLFDHERYESIGFSIAIDDAIPIAEELISKGYVAGRARVGFTYYSIGDNQANSYGLPSGMCVMGVDPECDIAYSGIRKYDIVTYIDGERMFGPDELFPMLEKHVPGDTVEVIFTRKEITGEVSTFRVNVKLADDKPSGMYGGDARSEDNIEEEKENEAPSETDGAQ